MPKPITTRSHKLLSILCLCRITVYAQQDTTSPKTRVDQAISVSDKSLKYINDKYSKLATSVDKQTVTMLSRLQKNEERLRRKLALKDSTKAAALFGNSEKTYHQLQNKLKSPIDKAVQNPLKEYIPGMDSVQTAMRFLEQNGSKLPQDKLQRVKEISGQLQELQGKLQQANEIQSFIRQREQELKQQLTQLGLGKELLGMNKQVVYYQQQLAEYKSLLNDRKKLEEKAISLIRELFCS